MIGLQLEIDIEIDRYQVKVDPDIEIDQDEKSITMASLETDLHILQLWNIYLYISSSTFNGNRGKRGLGTSGWGITWYNSAVIMERQCQNYGIDLKKDILHATKQEKVKMLCLSCLLRWKSFVGSNLAASIASKHKSDQRKTTQNPKKPILSPPPPPNFCTEMAILEGN